MKKLIQKQTGIYEISVVGSFDLQLRPEYLLNEARNTVFDLFHDLKGIQVDITATIMWTGSPGATQVEKWNILEIEELKKLI